MPVTVPPSVTPAPSPAPSRGDRSTFSTRVDALMNWLSNAAAQFSDLADNVYSNTLVANTAAATAESTVNITKWVSGTTYAEGNVTWSPIDFLAYRRKLAGAGTTDPSADSTNWAAITPSIASEKDSSNGYPGLTLFKINMLNVAGTFTSFLTNTNTASRTYTWPDKDGTVAMTSDLASSFISTSPTAGIGYGTGAGGTVTQTTSKTNAVTINKVTGIITTHAALLSYVPGSNTVFFIVNNSSVQVNDLVVLNIQHSWADRYDYGVSSVASGAFTIWLKNDGGSDRSDALPIHFAIIRGATA